jgi:hypothetical protein
VHDAVTFACALHEALHSASALGPVIEASQRGACHVPVQLAWQVASHDPLHVP